MKTLYDNIKRGFKNRGLRKVELEEIAKDVVRGAVEGEGFHIPDIFEICDKYPKIKQRYKNIYKAEIDDDKLLNKVSEDVMIVQGMLMDGLVSAYKVIISSKNDETQSELVANLKKSDKSKKDAMVLMTRDFHGVFESNQKNFTDMKKLATKNAKGALDAYRIVPEYKAGTEDYSIVATTPEEKVAVETTLKQIQSVTVHHKGVKAGNYIMTPYLVIERIMEELTNYAMKDVLRITTQGYGFEKVRDVTGNVAVLRNKKLNKDRFDVEVRVDKFPMTGVMYIPIVGVPTLTVAKERIDLHLIQNLEMIPVEDYEPSEVAKASTPQTEIRDIEIDDALYMLKDMCEQYCQYSKPSDANPELRAIMDELGIHIADLNLEYISYLSGAVSNLHGATTFAQRANIIKGIKGLKKLISTKKALYDEEGYDETKEFDMRVYDGDPATRIAEINKLLARGVCRLQYVNNNLTFSTMIGTTNKQALDTAYGADWYWKVASNTQKLKYLYDKAMEGEDIKEIMNHIHIQGADNKDIVTEVENVIVTNPSYTEQTQESLENVVGLKTKKVTPVENRVTFKKLYGGVPGHIYTDIFQQLGGDKILKVILLKEFK